MEKVDRAREILNEEGLGNLLVRSLGYTHRKTIRRLLPRVGYPVFNDVKVVGDKHHDHFDAVTDRKLFDGYLPSCFHRAIKPDKEGALVISHEAVTQAGDSVVIIGGGWGVTTVRAARIVGETGHIQVFEGARVIVDDLKTVVSLNNVEDHCEIVHAVVTDNYGLWGDEKPTSPTMSPTEIPDCDVLEMDCQGGELEIVREMEITPRALIIEVHPVSFPEEYEDLFDTLADRGYEITHRFDHDGVPVDHDTLLEMCQVHAEGGELSNPNMRNPPVIVAQLVGG